MHAQVLYNFNGHYAVMKSISYEHNEDNYNKIMKSQNLMMPMKIFPTKIDELCKKISLNSPIKSS